MCNYVLNVLNPEIKTKSILRRRVLCLESILVGGRASSIDGGRIIIERGRSSRINDYPNKAGDSINHGVVKAMKRIHILAGAIWQGGIIIERG
jgi:hypothetical protein